MISLGCPSRTEIEAAAYLNNSPIPVEICEKEPRLKDYGFYRKLNDGRLEFISFCDGNSVHWIAFYDQDLKKILDALLPKK